MNEWKRVEGENTDLEAIGDRVAYVGLADHRILLYWILGIRILNVPPIESAESVQDASLSLRCGL